MMLYDIALFLCFLLVSGCVFGLSISAFPTLLFFPTCGSPCPLLYRTKGLVLHLPLFLSPPFLSGEREISGCRPICRCCVVIAFCWWKKRKIKIDSLWCLPLSYFPRLSFLSMWRAVVWGELISNAIVFLLFTFHFSHMHCYRLSAFPFLCLFASHFFPKATEESQKTAISQNSPIIGGKHICF